MEENSKRKTIRKNFGICMHMLVHLNKVIQRHHVIIYKDVKAKHTSVLSLKNFFPI